MAFIDGGITGLHGAAVAAGWDPEGEEPAGPYLARTSGQPVSYRHPAGSVVTFFPGGGISQGERPPLPEATVVPLPLIPVVSQDLLGPVIPAPDLREEVPIDMVTPIGDEAWTRLPAGTDLRDLAVIGDGPLPVSSGVDASLGVGVIALSRLLALVPVLARFFSGVARGTRIRVAALPPWVRQAMALAGVTGILEIVVDALPGVDDGLIPGFGLPDLPANVGGIQVVGSWVANGVRFYRLSDGRLAVQNSKGRWKIWRPKRPIVMFGNGAKDVPTMLRADAALNRQAKRVRKMLDRRAPRARKSAAKSAMPVADGKIIQVRSG